MCFERLKLQTGFSPSDMYLFFFICTNRARADAPLVCGRQKRQCPKPCKLNILLRYLCSMLLIAFVSLGAIACEITAGAGDHKHVCHSDSDHTRYNLAIILRMCM